MTQPSHCQGNLKPERPHAGKSDSDRESVTVPHGSKEINPVTVTLTDLHKKKCSTIDGKTERHAKHAAAAKKKGISQ